LNNELSGNMWLRAGYPQFKSFRNAVPVCTRSLYSSSGCEAQATDKGREKSWPCL